MNKIDQILNFPNYHSAGEIEFGIHGPEIDNGNLYISIFHYLEFLGEDPRKYNTLRLGNYLTRQSNNDYKTCKYQTQGYSINKFKLNLLEQEESIFSSYIK